MHKDDFFHQLVGKDTDKSVSIGAEEDGVAIGLKFDGVNLLPENVRDKLSENGLRTWTQNLACLLQHSKKGARSSYFSNLDI